MSTLEQQIRQSVIEEIKADVEIKVIEDQINTLNDKIKKLESKKYAIYDRTSRLVSSPSLKVFLDYKERLRKEYLEDNN